MHQLKLLRPQKISGERAFVTLATSKANIGPKCLFDTRASVSMLTLPDFEAFRKRGLVRQKLEDLDPHITNASGDVMASKGVYDINFYFKGKPCHGVFIVSSTLPSHSIVGMNIMRAYNLTLDPM